MVVAMTLAGDLTFNPLTDSLKDKDGKDFKLKAPTGDGLPSRGYDPGQDTFQAPPVGSIPSLCCSLANLRSSATARAIRAMERPGCKERPNID